MTPPDSRDSVERVVAEMRRRAGCLPAVSDWAGVVEEELHDWMKRLQALARGPQRAGGEDWPKVMGEYLVIMTRCEASIRESGKATLSRADMEAIERYNLADEHLSMMQADRIAELEAALREAQANDRRYRWLRDSQNCSLSLSHNEHHNMYETVEQTFENHAGDPKSDYYGEVPTDERARMIETDTIWTLHIYPNTPVGFNVHHAATLDAAIDAALNGGQDDA